MGGDFQGAFHHAVLLKRPGARPALAREPRHPRLYAPWTNPGFPFPRGCRGRPRRVWPRCSHAWGSSGWSRGPGPSCLRDQVLLAGAALKGTQNQLEAERILGRRELGAAKGAGPQGAGFSVELLSPPEGPGPARRPGGSSSGRPREPCGAQGLRPAGGQAGPRLPALAGGPGAGLPGRTAAWWERRRPKTGRLPRGAALPVEPGCRFLLLEWAAGGAKTLESARLGGPIVLASLPDTGKIHRR